MQAGNRINPMWFKLGDFWEMTTHREVIKVEESTGKLRRLESSNGETIVTLGPEGAGRKTGFTGKQEKLEP